VITRQTRTISVSSTVSSRTLAGLRTLSVPFIRISCGADDDRSRTRLPQDPPLRNWPRLRHRNQSAYRQGNDAWRIVHGIGAALLEEFVYDEQGQMITQTFMDYLLPSSHEMPEVEIIHHCTPSPFTVFGQKGSGESGYLGAPAAISSALNDAVRPLGITIAKLPIRAAALSDAIAAVRQASNP
jgi:hypothetical protein